MKEIHTNHGLLCSISRKYRDFFNKLRCLKSSLTIIEYFNFYFVWFLGRLAQMVEIYRRNEEHRQWIESLDRDDKKKQ